MPEPIEPLLLTLHRGAPATPLILPFAIGYAIFEMAFPWIFFTSPVKPAAASHR